MRAFCALLIAIISFDVMAMKLKKVEAAVDHIFVPHGFDNNDQVELVVTGTFPNPCFARNKYQVRKRRHVIKIKISSFAKSDTSSPKCDPLKVTFTELINLGKLKSGVYEIIVNRGGLFERREKIVISKANSKSEDENIYAQIDSIDKGFTGGASGEVMLIAQTPSPCLILDRLEYLTNNKDTLSVLPVMKRVSRDCPEEPQRLLIPIKFNINEFKSDKILLFVRSIDGNSVSSIISR